MSEDPPPSWYLLQFFQQIRKQLKAGTMSRDEVVVSLVSGQRAMQMLIEALLQSRMPQIVIIPETWPEDS